MNQHPFIAFVAFQREVLSFQQRQRELAEMAVAAGKDAVAFQRAATRAAEDGVKSWQSWIALWGLK